MNTRMRPERLRRFWRCRLMTATTFTAIAAAATLTLTNPDPASASQNGLRQQIREAQTFFAYTGPGEALQASFVKDQQRTGANSDTVFTVTSPAGVATTCTVLNTAAITTSGCSFGQAVAGSLALTPTVGVWSIALSLSNTTPATAVPTGDHFTWSIDAFSGATPLPGRVYSEEFRLVQTTWADRPDIPLWYVTRDGYRYRATYFSFVGVDSVFTGSPIGVARQGTCNTAYSSRGRRTVISPPATTAETANFYLPTTCGGRSKIFFETPDLTMPSSAPIAGGSTWLLTTPTTPTINSPQYATTTPTSRSGTFTFSVADFVGNLDVLVDTNGDGNFSGPEDRKIPVLYTGGVASVPFDGIDGAGNPIPLDRAFDIQVQISKVGEVHFTNTDVEVRTPGIEVLALNGAAAGTPAEYTVYWNDTELDPAFRCTTTAATDGRGGVNSQGGVHGWAECVGGESATNRNSPNSNTNTGSWGDARDIDEWTYQPANVVRGVNVPIPARTVSIDKTVVSSTPVGGGQFDTVYDIVVTNTGVVTTTYVLTDTLQYSSAVTLGSRSVVVSPNTVPAPSPSWTGLAPNTSVTSAPVTIAAGAAHTYRVTARATVPTTITAQQSDCDLQSGESGTGFLNGTTMSSEGESFSDTACVPTPRLSIDKSMPSAPIANGDGTYTVTYDVTVANSGGAAASYDLSDALQLGTGATVSSATVANTSPGTIATLAAWNGAASTAVVTGQPIAANTTHVYRVTIVVAVPTTMTSTASDCTLEGSETGTGFRNSATLTSNGQTQSDVECAPVPRVTIDKTITAGPTADGAGGYTVTYQIVVANPSGASAVYNLDDALQFGSGITVTSSSVTSTAPAGLPTSTTWNGTSDLRVITGQQIAAAASHTYQVTVTAAVPLTIAAFSANCVLGATEQGTGLLNAATVTQNGQTQTDTACAPVPNVTVSKTVLTGPTANGSGTYSIQYEVVVANTSAVPTTYDLDDQLRFGQGVVVTNASVEATSPVASTLANWTGTAPTTRIVSGRAISAGASHRYVVSVTARVPLTVTTGARDCDLTGTESGSGLLNAASITSNGQSSSATACAPIPSIVVAKAIVGTPTANGDGTFTVRYRVTVTNSGVVSTQYDLSDTLRFGAGIGVNSATIDGSSPAALSFNTGWNGVTDVGIISGQAIAAGVSHTFDLDVVANVPTSVTLADRDCELGSGGVGTGLFNTASLSSNGQTQTADACAPLPAISIDKTLVEVPTPTGGGAYTVTYDITVTNSGAVPTTYDLTDDLRFGQGVTIGSGPVVTPTPNTISVNPLWNGTSTTRILSGQTIAAGESHVFRVVVSATVPLSITTSASDCSLTSAETGTGLLNSASLTSNGQTLTDTACAPTPSVAIDKSLVGTPVENGDGTYTVTYEVTVANRGDLATTYGLDDTLRFGAGVTVIGVPALSNTVPGTITPRADWTGSGTTTRVVTAQPLGAQSSHVYRVVVVAGVSPTVTTSAADCELVGTESGTGLLNTAALAVNGRSVQDDACAPVPMIEVRKNVVSSTPNGDSTFTVIYDVSVVNVGAAATRYDLSDTLAFGAGVTIVSANATNTVPGTISVTGWNGTSVTQLVAREPIGAGETDTYRVTVRAGVPVTVTLEARDCTRTSTETGTGFLNSAQLTHNGTPLTTTACAPIPFVSVGKIVRGEAASTGDGVYTVTYDIVVTNTSQATATYDLDDQVKFAPGMQVLTASVAQTTPANIPTNADWNGQSVSRLVVGRPLAPGQTETFTVVITARSQSAISVSGSDCVVDADESGTGFLNSVSISANDIRQTATACVDVPSLAVSKAIVGAPTLNEDGSTTITYEIKVENSGSGVGVYSLVDQLRYGAGIPVLQATVSNVAPGDIATNSSWDGRAVTAVATGVTIRPRTTHVYRVIVLAGLIDSTTDPTSLNCAIEVGESGSGFGNTASIGGSGSTSVTAACASIAPQPELPKTGGGLSVLPLAQALVAVGFGLAVASRYRRRPTLR
jgi:methionine-rich copper-binding protein CopC